MPPSESTYLREAEQAPKRREGCCFQDPVILVRLVTVVSAAAEGYEIGYYGAVAHSLQEEFGMPASMVGPVGAVLVLFVMFGCLVSGVMCDAIGRKRSLAVTYVMLIIGSLVMALSPALWVFILGRVLVGLGIGMGLTCVSIYISEVSPAKVRGTMTSMEELFLNFGIFLSFGAAWLLMGRGYAHDWRWLVGIGTVLPTIMLFVILQRCIPESPRYLHLNARGEEARMAFKAFHYDCDEAEMRSVFASWDEEAASRGKAHSYLSSCREVMGSKPFIPAVLVVSTQIGGGIVVIVQLCSFMLVAAGQEASSTYFPCMLIAAFKFVALLPSCLYMIDAYGRRPLLLMSSFGSGVLSVVVGLCFAFKLGHEYVTACLCIMVVFFSLGLGPVPYVYVSEVFPTHLRGPGVGLVFGLSRFLTVIEVAVAPAVMAISTSGLFFFFAAVYLAGCGLIYLRCPETKNKTLEELHGIWA